ncbi:HEAT repeat domain-containing protein, partial [Acidobacteria bacterium AH-259-O06]|nr:HEAT repeat domain-containing protein [Acidobacteria bacterium AH-259-O06]
MQSLNVLKLIKIAALVLVLGLLAWAGIKFFLPAGKGSERRQLTGLEAIQVPEGFAVEKVAGPDLTSYPMFAILDQRDRLFVFESTGPNTMTTEEMLADPAYLIRILEDGDGDGIYDEGKVFADQIPLPMGGVWHQGSLYAAASPNLLRFDDTDDDGVADHREVILTGWTLNVNAATLHGPFWGPDGWLYLTDARRGYKIETKEGTVLEAKGGRIWRCRPDGTGLEWVSAGGFDNPVELVFMPSGEILGTMTYFTNPRLGQRDALMHWVEGGVYPKWHQVIDEDKLKRTGDLMPVMSKFPRVAPSGLVRFRSRSFGSEYEGNLFSVQFNTHRVVRHIVFREGATFRTKDENFLTSSDPNFHPTDLIEAADGTLLVLDTGGWFIKGCPVSRVTRPEFRGGVYRIRRIGTPRVEDPRGKKLKLETLSPEEWVQYMEDSRPVVRDRAVELLVEGGEVSALTGVLRSSRSPEVRCTAVFGLSRIGTADARQAVREALQDPDFQVRVAAARALGMSKDRAALDRLVEMLQDNEPAVRRQAATALGQIQDKRATRPLLSASAQPLDRFVEHSIIYALISLEDPVPVIQALKNSSPKVQKAALIALDQMDGTHLRRSHLAPFVGAEDKDLRHAALWVLAHHPGWSGEVLQFLRTRLSDPELSQDEAEAVREVLVSLCEDKDVQALMAELLGKAGLHAQRRVFLLDTIEQCGLQELPRNWVEQIRDQLRASDLDVRLRAVALGRSWRIAELEDELEGLANNQAEPVNLRTAALAALVMSRPQLPDSQFEFLRERLNPRTQATVRLLAAQAVGQADLSDEQLLVLARRHLHKADPLILTSLLDAFRHNSSAQVGESLVAALLKSSQGMDHFQDGHLRELFSSFPEHVQTEAKPLFEHFQKIKEERIQRLRALEDQLSGGEVASGRKIFFGEKVACSSCHTIGVEGSEVGPDLTSIGAIRSRHDLLESIIFPSAAFVRGHESYRVETANETYSGIMGKRTSDAVVLITGPDSKLRIPRDQIVSMQPSTVSLMPEGLDEALTHS